MIRAILFASLCILLSSNAFAQTGKQNKNNTPAPFTLADKQDSLGYAIGIDIATNLKKQGIELDIDALAQAMKDLAAAKTPLLNEQQSKQVLSNLQMEMQMKAAETKKAKATAALQAAQKFLAENKTKPGVIELPSGLQYIIVKEGTGKSPTLASKVTTHYHGMLMDGTVFDSSVNRGQPATFPLSNVIQAWQQILPLMKEGGKVTIYCPPALAYGENGMGQTIGPNELLIFDIELIKVE